jgi:radical SAM domain protein
MGSPIRANVEITDACPLACEHCYTYWGWSSTGIRNSRDRSGRTLIDLEPVIDTLISAGVQVVTFTGGEPLLRRDLLLPLIRHCKASGIRVLLNTSAVFITKSTAHELADSGLDGALVSLMSANATINNQLAHANSYTRTMRGAQLLASTGIKVTINMVCSKTNHDTVRTTAQLACDLGAQMFSATPMLPTAANNYASMLHLSAEQMRNVMFDLAWARDNLPIRVTTLDPVAHCAFNADEREFLGDLLTQRYCAAGITDCAVSPDGDLRACIMTGEVGGNILRDGWDTAWEQLANWRSEAMLPVECLQCNLVDQCGGGCRVAAHAVTGQFNGRDPYMTSPITTTDTKLTTSADTNIATILDTDDLVEFDPKVTARAEPFGGTLFIDGKATFLKQAPFDLVLERLSSGPFTAHDWAAATDASPEAVISFMSVLAADGFLRRSPRRC